MACWYSGNLAWWGLLDKASHETGRFIVGIPACAEPQNDRQHDNGDNSAFCAGSTTHASPELDLVATTEGAGGWPGRRRPTLAQHGESVFYIFCVKFGSRECAPTQILFAHNPSHNLKFVFFQRQPRQR